MDVAEIGFRVDTGDLENARAKLTALGPAATTAAKASDMLSGSLADTGTAAQQAAAGVSKASTAAAQAAAGVSKAGAATMTLAAADDAVAAASGAAAAGIAKTGVAANAATGNIVKLTVAANNNAHAHQAMSTQAMAMQHSLRSSVEMLAMGIPPTQILASQMNHLSYAMSGEGGLAGAASALGSSLKTLLSPINLLGIGIFGLTIILLTLVNWAGVAKSALLEFANILPTIAPYLVGIGIAMAIAFGPAILGMISVLSGAVLSLTAYMFGLAIGFAAANPAVAFILGFALVIAALNIFRDEFKKVFGTDLLGDIEYAANYIVGTFVGAYEGLVAVWDKLPAAFADLAVAAGNALISGIESALNYISNAVGKFWNQLSELTGGAVGKAKMDAFQLPRIENPNAGAAAGVANDIGSIVSKAQGVDYVGKAIAVIGTAASGAAAKVRALANAIGATDDAKKKSKGGKTDEQKFDDIVKGADNTIAKLTAERDAIGMTELATAQLKYQTQLLNEARQKGIELTPAGRAQLIGLANDMAALEVQTKKVKEAFDFAKDITKGFFSDFEQGIINGEGFWKSFGDAALNALNKIVDKILNDVIDSIFQMNAAASAGGGGFLSQLMGIFGSIGGGGTNLFPSAPLGGGSSVGGLWAKGGSFAKGGDFTNSIVSRSTPFSFAKGTKIGEMGEAGPEAIVPLKRMGNGDMGIQAVMPQQSANSNGPTGPRELNVNVSGARGNAEITEMVRQGVEQGINQYDTYVIPSRVNEVAAQPRVR